MKALQIVLAIVGFFLAFALTDFFWPRQVDLRKARELADARYWVYAKSINAEEKFTGSLEILERKDDYLFVYDVPEKGRKIVVIVDKKGGVADGLE